MVTQLRIIITILIAIILMTPAYACIDSDGGANPTEPGFVQNREGARKDWDKCFGAIAVYEKYCDEGLYPSSIMLNCPSGTECRGIGGAACRVPPDPATLRMCADTDDGMYLHMQAVLEVRDGYGSILQFALDTCAEPPVGAENCTTDEKCYVEEYQCEAGGAWSSQVLRCPDGYWCDGGECIDELREGEHFERKEKKSAIVDDLIAMNYEIAEKGMTAARRALQEDLILELKKLSIATGRVSTTPTGNYIIQMVDGRHIDIDRFTALKLKRDQPKKVLETPTGFSIITSYGRKMEFEK